MQSVWLRKRTMHSIGTSGSPLNAEQRSLPERTFRPAPPTLVQVGLERRSAWQHAVSSWWTMHGARLRCLVKLRQKECGTGPLLACQITCLLLPLPTETPLTLSLQAPLVVPRQQQGLIVPAFWQLRQQLWPACYLAANCCGDRYGRRLGRPLEKLRHEACFPKGGRCASKAYTLAPPQSGTFTLESTGYPMLPGADYQRPMRCAVQCTPSIRRPSPTMSRRCGAHANHVVGLTATTFLPMASHGAHLTDDSDTHYPSVERLPPPGLEPATFRSRVEHPSH